MMSLRFFISLFVAFTLSFSAHAVNPDEILDDPALEQRARDISANLRCLVCQNQSIDDSDAELARDLRVIVRERLVGGDTDAQVLDYVVSRYGEFVLLRPSFSAQNIALWATPIVVLLIGGLGALIYVRGHRRQVSVEPLDEAEQQRLANLLHEGDQPKR